MSVCGPKSPVAAGQREPASRAIGVAHEGPSLCQLDSWETVAHGGTQAELPDPIGHGRADGELRLRMVSVLMLGTVSGKSSVGSTGGQRSQRLHTVSSIRPGVVNTQCSVEGSCCGTVHLKSYAFMNQCRPNKFNEKIK